MHNPNVEHFTSRDCTEREIVPSLGKWADQYDVEAIADELVIGVHTDNGLRFILDPDKDFWAVVAKHDLTDN